MTNQVVRWEPYRPANGTEGEIFMEVWCNRCKRDQAHQESGGVEEGCPIVAATFVYKRTDPEYPAEWRRQADDDEWPGTAECTAFEAIGTPERCKHTADMFHGDVEP